MSGGDREKVILNFICVFPQISLEFHHVKSDQQNDTVFNGIDPEEDTLAVSVQSEALRDQRPL